MSANIYNATRARLIAYLCQAGLSTRKVEANLDAFLEAARQYAPAGQETRPNFP